MSAPDRQTPPAGEQIHMPGPSLQPLLLAVGITCMLVGITVSLILVIVGGVLALVTLLVWISDARAEFEDLPAEHRH